MTTRIEREVNWICCHPRYVLSLATERNARRIGVLLGRALDLETSTPREHL